MLSEYLYMIRNIKTLDKEMINNIRQMTDEEKVQIIIAFNEVVECMKYVIDTT